MLKCCGTWTEHVRHTVSMQSILAKISQFTSLLISIYAGCLYIYSFCLMYRLYVCFVSAILWWIKLCMWNNTSKHSYLPYYVCVKCEWFMCIHCLAAVNTPAAELLYTSISDLCRISFTSTLLDVCCGTGTIGLTLAKVHSSSVFHVSVYLQLFLHLSLLIQQYWAICTFSVFLIIKLIYIKLSFTLMAVLSWFFNLVSSSNC